MLYHIYRGHHRFINKVEATIGHVTILKLDGMALWFLLVVSFLGSWRRGLFLLTSVKETFPSRHWEVTDEQGCYHLIAILLLLLLLLILLLQQQLTTTAPFEGDFAKNLQDLTLIGKHRNSVCWRKAIPKNKNTWPNRKWERHTTKSTPDASDFCKAPQPTFQAVWDENQQETKRACFWLDERRQVWACLASKPWQQQQRFLLNRKCEVLDPYDWSHFAPKEEEEVKTCAEYNTIERTSMLQFMQARKKPWEKKNRWNFGFPDLFIESFWTM